jgi:hypothetical protein
VSLAERVIELHRALERRGIPHAFGGAVALAFWIRNPRGTDDVDVNIFLPASDSGPALDALPAGVSVPDDAAAVIARDGQTRLWWDETPVDVFFDNVPVHEDAARHRRTVPLTDDVTIPILGPVELAVFKIMFDRTRDWADIEEMIAAETLDLDEVRRILATMLPEDDERFSRIDDAVRQAARHADPEPRLSRLTKPPP